MSIASDASAPQAKPRKLKIVREVNNRLSPKQAARAREGARLKMQIAAAKKALQPIDDEFAELFAERKVRELTDGRGRTVAVLNHGEPSVLDQPYLKAHYPEIADECTWPHPWDKPSYVWDESQT